MNERGRSQDELPLIWSTLILMYQKGSSLLSSVGQAPDVTLAMNLSFVGAKNISKEENVTFNEFFICAEKDYAQMCVESS